MESETQAVGEGAQQAPPPEKKKARRRSRKRAPRVAPPPEGAELIKVGQAAHLVQASEWLVRRLIREGKLKRYGEGRLWRVRRSEVLAALETEKPQPTAPQPFDAKAHAAALVAKKGARRG